MREQNPIVDSVSITSLLERLNKNQEDVETLYELARVSMSIGRNNEAKLFLARVVALEPWHEAARTLLNQIEQERHYQTLDDVVTKTRNVLHKRQPETTATSRIPESAEDSQPDYYTCSRPEIQKLVRRDARRILDIGCAAGMLGYELKQKLGAEVWGVEYVASVAKEAATRLDRVISGAIEDGLEQLPDRYFDTIICADVLEHLINPWQLLKALASKLTADGEIVVSIPNVRHWQVIRTLLEGSWRYEDAGILDRTHLRFFTKSDAIKLFESSGYEIINGEAISYEGDNAPPDAVVKALKIAGLAVDTLAEESRHYQYLLVARPSNTTIDAKELHEPSSYHDLTSIIILTRNQLPLTKICFASIIANTPEPYELIVIDNGSSDGTVEWLREQAEADTRIRLIENSVNKGFAAGCNQGITAAHGEYLLLLNNDTVVTPGWLSGLREVLDRYPDTGIVGPMTNSASGIQVVADTGYTSLPELPAWSATFRRSNRFQIIPQRRIVGFCMLFRKDLIKKTGLLDESFGSGNYEDDDLCLRAELAGYRNLIAGDVFIHHEGGATFSGNCIDRGEKNRTNRTIFKQKWDPSRLDETVLRKWLVLDAIGDAAIQSQRGDIEGAIQTLLNQGIKIAPDSPAPYIELAELLIAAGRHDEALQVLPEMPDSTDQTLKAELEAICRSALGEDAAARDAALKASNRPRALVVLGILAARHGDLIEAERLFRQSIAAGPSCGNGWLSLGMLLWSQGKHDDAWQAVKRAVTVDPLNRDGVKIFCDMAGRLGHEREALERLESALLIYPDCRHVALHKSVLSAQCGELKGCLDDCEKFLARFGIDDEIMTLGLSRREVAGLYDRVVEGGGNAVSLCMIVKDEESSLPRALASAKPVVHEIVVVDTGSSDRTVDVARLFGARVVQFPWNGSFADARNAAIQNARGAWILSLDADEVLSRDDYDAISRLIESADRGTAFSVLTRNYSEMMNAHGWTPNDGAYPREERGSGWLPSRKVRLFPRDSRFRFAGDVHEMVETSLRTAKVTILDAPFVIHHYGFLGADPERLRKKQEEYFRLGLKKVEENPDDMAAICELAVQAGELGRFEEGIELWDRVLLRHPEYVEALFNKGYCLMMLGRYHDAMICSERVLEKESDHREAALNYGVCALYAGSPESALPVVLRVMEKYPRYPLLKGVATALHVVTGDSAEALRLFTGLEKEGFDIRSYLRERGEKLRTLGRHDRAASIERFLG